MEVARTKITCIPLTSEATHYLRLIDPPAVLNPILLQLYRAGTITRVWVAAEFIVLEFLSIASAVDVFNLAMASGMGVNGFDDFSLEFLVDSPDTSIPITEANMSCGDIGTGMGEESEQTFPADFNPAAYHGTLGSGAGTRRARSSSPMSSPPVTKRFRSWITTNQPDASILSVNRHNVYLEPGENSAGHSLQ